MAFLLPQMLWLALLLPLLIGAYLWVLRRRRHAALRYAGLELIKSAQGSTFLWRRHLPPAIIFLALALLMLAAARPTTVVTLPLPRQTILLVMDVSISMSADDVPPNRLSASRIAAMKFVSELPGDVRIGVIAYGGTAHLVQRPTLSRDDVLAAIDSLRLQRSTGIGAAIVLALETLFPDDDIVLPEGTSQSKAGKPAPLNSANQETTGPANVAPGSYGDAVIVLLTDGQNTSGPSPLDAAQLAADRGVRVFTVGFGTKDGVIVGYQGQRIRVSLDEKTLEYVANLTLGQYFYAASGAELETVYDALKSRVVLERQRTEVTFVFAGTAALLVVLAAALSMWWSGRVA